MNAFYLKLTDHKLTSISSLLDDFTRSYSMQLSYTCCTTSTWLYRIYITNCFASSEPGWKEETPGLFRLDVNFTWRGNCVGKFGSLWAVWSPNSDRLIQFFWLVDMKTVDPTQEVWFTEVIYWAGSRALSTINLNCFIFLLP